MVLPLIARPYIQTDPDSLFLIITPFLPSISQPVFIGTDSAVETAELYAAYPLKAVVSVPYCPSYPPQRSVSTNGQCRF